MDEDDEDVYAPDEGLDTNLFLQYPAGNGQKPFNAKDEIPNAQANEEGEDVEEDSSDSVRCIQYLPLALFPDHIFRT